MIRTDKTCLLFFDVDGTLMINGTVSEKNIEAVNKVKALGHKVFINTGRSKGFIQPEILNMTKWDGLIAGSAYTELDGKIILNEVLSKKNIADVYSYCSENNIPCLFEGVDTVYSINHSYGIDISGNIDTFLKSSESDRITKITFGRPRSEKQLEFEGIKILQFVNYAEGIIQGYSKSTGMKLICEKLKTGREQCIAFGDSENDIEMLEYARTGVVIGHAPASLDAYAEIRTKKEEDGVAEAIEKLFF